MIPTKEFLGAFDDRDVLCPLNDAHHIGVAAQITTDRTFGGGCDVEAPDAGADLLAHVGDRSGEPGGIDLLHIQQVERQPLGGLAPDTWKSRKLVDQPLNRTLEHQPRDPPSPSPISFRMSDSMKMRVVGVSDKEPPPATRKSRVVEWSDHWVRGLTINSPQ